MHVPDTNATETASDNKRAGSSECEADDQIPTREHDVSTPRSGADELGAEPGKLRTTSQRTRTVAGGMIHNHATLALEAASRADTPQARHAAVRPHAEKIHAWSTRFAGHPPERTAQETTDLVMEHVGRQLDLPAARRSSGPHRSQTHNRPTAPETTPGPRARAPEPEPATVPRPPGADMNTLSAGLAPVETKLPAALPPGGAVNTGPGRTPRRDQVRTLRAAPARGLNRSRQLGR